MKRIPFKAWAAWKVSCWISALEWRLGDGEYRDLGWLTTLKLKLGNVWVDVFHEHYQYAKKARVTVPATGNPIGTVNNDGEEEK